MHSRGPRPKRPRKQPLPPAGRATVRTGSPDSATLPEHWDGVAEYTRLVQELSESLASPDRGASDAVEKYQALMYRFSEETPQAPLGRTTYLPKANLDNIREIVSAKRLHELTNEVGFRPGNHESTIQNMQTPDYVFDDGAIGDRVRISAKDEAGFVKALRDAVSKKITTYSKYVLPSNPEQGVAPINVVVDASDIPALKDMSDAKLDELLSQVGQEFLNGKLQRIVVLSKGTQISRVILSNNQAQAYGRT